MVNVLHGQDSTDLSHDEFQRLASPILLGHGSNLLDLRDYFDDPSIVDSVKTDARVPIHLQDGILSIESRPAMTRMSTLRFFCGASYYDVLLRAPRSIPISIKLMDRGYKSVKIKGEMTDWSSDQIIFNKEEDFWIGKAEINPGKYPYLFEVDGKDQKDPANAAQVPDGTGGDYSLMTVGEYNFDQRPRLISNRFNESSVFIEAYNKVHRVYAFWNNERAELLRLESDPSLDASKYVINIPSKSAKIKRSYLRVYAYNQAGIANDLLIPLEYGHVIQDPALLGAHDPYAQANYFMFKDSLQADSPTNAASDELGIVEDLSGIKELISSEQIQAQFDLDFHDAIRKEFARAEPSFELLNQALRSSFENYGSHASMTIPLGSQQLIKFEAFAKAEDQIKEEKRLDMLFGFIMTIPAAPLFRLKDFNPENTSLKNRVDQISKLRKARLSLTYGDTRILASTEHSISFIRSYFDEHTIVIMNKSSERQKLQLEDQVFRSKAGLKSFSGAHFSVKAAGLEMELEPWTYEILLIN